jgi:hypothetical protein
MIQDLIKQPRIFFNCEDQESYSIDDFCDDKELLLIHREFLNADIKSYNGKIHQLAHPIHNPVIGEISDINPEPHFLIEVDLATIYLMVLTC